MVDLARIEREDIVAFLNAGLAATAQAEFYQDRFAQESGVTFLHAYVAFAYRDLYAGTLALELNDYNKALTIKTLLCAGAPSDAASAKREGQLISNAMRALPPNRAYDLLYDCALAKRSNRRLRATAREYILSRGAHLPLHVLKYRRKMRRIVRHCHLKLDEESQSVLFAFNERKQAYSTALYETFRRAHYSKQAIYELPYSIAEGLISRHGISRATFLEKIKERMTKRERERTQRTLDRHGVEVSAQVAKRMELTRQLQMVLGMKKEEVLARREELESTVRAAAARAARGWPYEVDSISLILDNSYSSKSSRERSLRPLAIALSVLYVARAVCEDVRVHWTCEVAEVISCPLLIRPRGQTDLVRPLFHVLAQPTDLLLVCSDGYENSPAGGFNAVWNAWCARIRGSSAMKAVHINPVFDAQGFLPRRIAADVPSVSIHHASDIALGLVIAEFDSGALSLEALRRFIAQQR